VGGHDPGLWKEPASLDGDRHGRSRGGQREECSGERNVVEDASTHVCSEGSGEEHDESDGRCGPEQTQAQQPATTDKSALGAQGHNLIAQGNYDAAITTLQQAVKDCPVSTTDPCAYALFDLGHALRLAGRPSEAIPILQQRLQNPDQRATVQHELDLAEAAANGGAQPGEGKPEKD